MATIHFTKTTTATPEKFVAALTDFGPGRAEIWGNTADDQSQDLRAEPRTRGRHGGHEVDLGAPRLRLVEPERVVLKTIELQTSGVAIPDTPTR